MAQWLRVVTALTEDPHSIPRAHVVLTTIYSSVSKELLHLPLGSSGTRHTRGTQMYMKAKHYKVRESKSFKRKD